jgi:TolA-binding protein
MRSLHLATVAVGVLTATGGTVRADAFWVQTAAGAKPQQVASVKITGIEDGRLKDRSASGNDGDRALETVARLQLDDDAQLNSAEQAFSTGNWDAATDGYLKSLRGTSKDWLKPWIADRLNQAATKANRFDAAVVGFIDSVLRDPARASDNRPGLPDAKSSYLNTAVTEINNALSNAQLAPAQKQVLLSFLLDIHRARNDQRATADTMNEIMKLGEASGAKPGTPGAPNLGATGAQLARLKLDLASVALDGKQYQKAIDEITANKAVFVEPRDQSDALFYLAQAKHGLASASKDADALKDAAIAYMRVVAHFKDTQGKPHVADSLVNVARIEEELNAPADAARLYNQVATQYTDSPAAATAREALSRLNGATTSPAG